MPVQVNAGDGKGAVRIAISGRFDFALQSNFREAYRTIEGRGVEFRVNLAGADYLDSSALGMLLLLREHAEALAGRVVIEAPSPAVKRILDIARFDRLFAIESR